MQILLNQTNATKQPKEEEDDFIPTTKTEMMQLFKTWQQQQVQETQTVQQRYAQGYLGQLDKLETEEEDAPDLVAEIKELCTRPGKKFHVYRTGQGAIDAEINYHAAKAHLLKQKVATPKPKEIPLKGAPPKAPLGDGPSGTASSKPVKLTKVDSAAKKVAEHFGLNLASMGYEA